eukprot:358752-Chlamydomonas_euryale.AAC.27
MVRPWSLEISKARPNTQPSAGTLTYRQPMRLQQDTQKISVQDSGVGGNGHRNMIKNVTCGGAYLLCTDIRAGRGRWGEESGQGSDVHIVDMSAPCPG